MPTPNFDVVNGFNHNIPRRRNAYDQSNIRYVCVVSNSCPHTESIQVGQLPKRPASKVAVNKQRLYFHRVHANYTTNNVAHYHHLIATAQVSERMQFFFDVSLMLYHQLKSMTSWNCCRIAIRSEGVLFFAFSLAILIFQNFHSVP